VTLTIFGSTVGYPSDSLASCFNQHYTYAPGALLCTQHCNHLESPTAISIEISLYRTTLVYCYYLSMEIPWRNSNLFASHFRNP